jgi:antibiotic biosynthesis monooxygenase (ABM) superfamily enzyme
MQLLHAIAEWAYFQHQSIKGEINMAGMLVQHKVKNFTDWKKVYDTQAALRASNGMLSDQIYSDASDQNQLTVVFKWDSVENAQKFAQSPELKAAMEKAGVEGRPTIHFLNEA